MNDRQQQRQSNPSRCFFFIICIYLVYLSAHHSPNSSNLDELKKNIKNQSAQISIKNVLSTFLHEFQGSWLSVAGVKSSVQWKNSGRFYSNAYQNAQVFTLRLKVNNGYYIDDGIILIHIDQLNVSEWTYKHENKSVQIFPKQKVSIDVYQQQLMRTVSYTSQNATSTNLKIKLSVSQSDEFIRTFSFLELEGIPPLQLKIQGLKSNYFGLFSLMIIMFFIAFAELHSIVALFKALIDGTQQFSHYCFSTLLLALIWDGILCVMAFDQTFFSGNLAQNVLFFIVPGIIFCILFTNLELKLMFHVYRSDFDEVENVRRLICKFNGIIYGCIFISFALIYLLNLSNLIYIFASFIFAPQIYKNAIRNHIPNINSPYYSQFLVARFLIIIYLKCFPYNVYQFQPNFFLGIGCLGLVACQYCLLLVQKIYGPKKILPKCLLPPIYDYKCDIESIMSQTINNTECAICLGNLNDKPTDAPENLNVSYEVMKTPCEHHYHSSCLINWMAIKMQCPQCRTKLPDYQ